MTAAGGSPLNAGDLKRDGLVVRPRCSCHGEEQAPNGSCVHKRRAAQKRYNASAKGRAVHEKFNGRRLFMNVGGAQLYLGMSESPEEHAFATALIRQQKGNA